GARGSMTVGAGSYDYYRLDVLSDRIALDRTPMTVKILLENVLRHAGAGVVTPEDVDRLAAWLSARVPAEQETAIAHGDYRVGNLVLHAEEPRIVAVLDWELATLGHPVADLAYFCMPYHLPAGVPGVRGLQGLDLAALGIPGEEEILAAYCEHSGRPALPHWRFFLAFSLFRLAAILQGVAARAALGNASNADAREVGSRAGLLAAAGRRIAEGT
ncbi:MAG: phosphotransferase, partial [Tistlia sp.]